MGASAAIAARGVGMKAGMHQPEQLPGGVWQGLLKHAFTLIDEIAKRGISDPFWTFGGGTVLMLRYRHRVSKDIDIFVPDPQYLGFVSPRLSDVAESVTQDYVEGAGYTKLLRPEGEIDFVASPNLTEPAFEWWTLLGREVRVETAAEIVAIRPQRETCLIYRWWLSASLNRCDMPLRTSRATEAHFSINFAQGAPC
jgi:hypothetical protein